MKRGQPMDTQGEFVLEGTFKGQAGPSGGRFKGDTEECVADVGWDCCGS